MMRRLRQLSAIFIGKILIFLARRLRLGGGSSFPGRVALRLSPGLLMTLAGQVGRRVLVTATNGKTTTTRLVLGALRGRGLVVVSNTTGANMAGGIATSLIEAARFSGRLTCDIALFEVDEGSLPVVAPPLAPHFVLVGNFFRDQLDRYGEVAILARRVGETLAALSPAPALVLNADDPMVAQLAGGHGAPVSWFGMDDPQRGSRGLGAEADIRHCPLCHAFLKYSRAYLGHLGHFRCPACGFSRPKPGLSARSVKPRSLDLQEVEIVSGRARAWYTLRQPGDHAAYNLLGALALLGALGFDPLSFVEYCAGFTPPYGRFERFKVDGHPLTLILFKNPAGANVLFRMVAELVKDGRYLFLLNDLSADGRDVSWIYDADFELLAAGSRGAVTAGRRAAALALRLVHAGFPEKNIRIIPAPGAALDAALADLPRKAGLHVFATYTAMHELRRVLTARTGTHAFWEEK